MDDRNLSDLGKRINSVVQDAVNNMNFEQLNNQISSSINSAVNEVQKNLGIQNGNKNQQWKNGSQSGYANGSNTGYSYKWTSDGQSSQKSGSGSYQNYNQNINQNQQGKGYSYQQQQRNQTLNQTLAEIRQGYQAVRNSPNLHPAINRNPVGRVSGILYIVFGSIGLGVSLICLLASLLMFTINGLFSGGALQALLFFLATTAIFSGFLIGGIAKRRVVRRFYRYVKTINNRNYCTIEELSFGSGENKKYVIKDLRMMMRKGMFLEGHIDDEEKNFMLTYDVYQQYLDLKNNEQARIIDQQKVAQAKVAENSREIDERVKAVVLEGEQYVAQIQAANVAIPGKEVSDKLDVLENVIRKIFHHIERNPDQVSEIRQFTQYYLPTTLKLVNTYKDLDGQTIQRDNITSAKLEIEKTLATINLAFENLYDSLFEDVAMDVTTDISVLNTMLKREGLTEKDFN